MKRCVAHMVLVRESLDSYCSALVSATRARSGDVSSTFAICQVDSEELEAWFAAKLETWGSQYEISCLNPQEPFDTVKRLKGQLETIQQEVTKAAAPFRVAEFRNKLRQILPTFVETVDTIKDFQGCFKELEDKDALSRKNAKRLMRTTRDRIVAKLESQQDGVPKALAKVIAEMIQKTEEAGEALPFEAPELACDGTDQEAVISEFAKVRVLTDKTDTPTWWHGQAASFGETGDAYKKCLEKAETIQQSILASKGATKHGFATIANAGFDWVCGEGVDFLNIVPGLRTIVHTQDCHAFNAAPAAWPWKGCGMMLTAVVGTICVIILDEQQTIEAATDVDGFMRRADAKLVSQYTKVILGKGNSIYVPFGSMPMVIGLDFTDGSAKIKEKTRKGAKKEEDPPVFVTYCVNLVLRPAFDGSQSQPVRSNVLAAHHLASGSLPASLKNNKNFKTWVEALTGLIGRQHAIPLYSLVVAMSLRLIFSADGVARISACG